MKKKYFLILPLILIIFTAACTGYKPIFNTSSLMLEIKKHTIEGDQKLGEIMYLKLSNLLKAVLQFNIIFSMIKNSNFLVKIFILIETLFNTLWYSFILTFKPKKKIEQSLHIISQYYNIILVISCRT